MKIDSPLRVSVYGSCVSRDTLTHCSPDGLSLKRYTARQSLISAFTPSPVPALDLSMLASAFQVRMVQGDLESSFASDLTNISVDSDLLLWDLIDERLGIYELPGGGVITRSVELIASGHDKNLQNSAHFIPFGTEEHFRRWTTALSSFENLIHGSGLRQKTRLLAIPWARKDTDGKALPAQNGLEPSRANRVLRRYYRAAQGIIPIVKIGRVSRPRASTSHQWGTAPYHYEQTTYRSIANAVGLPLN